MRQQIRNNRAMIISVALVCALIFGIYLTTVITHAGTKQVVTITLEGLSIRADADKDSKWLGQVKKNEQYDVLDSKDDNRSPAVTWYKINGSYEGKIVTGYVSGTYCAESTVTIVDDGAIDTSTSMEPAYATEAIFEQALTAQGFPESYKVKLRTLHEKYPYFTFEAYDTGLSWSEVLAGETSYPSLNLIGGYYNTSWKSLDDGAYDWRTSTWTQYEPGWVSASDAIVAYYLDPRNFLDSETYLLQFQKLTYSASENLAGVQAIMGTYASTTQGKEIDEVFLEAGKVNNISAYHLASRAMQETGYGTGSGATGDYPGYEGYYNFYSIGAYGTDPPILAGLQYAKKYGWNSASKSVLGGAPFISKYYIAKQQDTLYFQKFDVVNVSGNFNHQYMTGIEGPTAEAKRLLKSYPDLTSINMTLSIPVYSSMPTSNPKPTSNADPNNTLKSLSINNYSLTPTFDVLTQSYSLVVPAGTTSISLSGTAASKDATISGLGTVKLDASGTTSAKVVVHPPYGSDRTYTIKITGSKQVLPNTSSNLSNLSVSGGTLSPTFSAATTSYTISANDSVKTLTLTGVAEDSAAKVSGLGKITLNDYGNTTIKVVVTPVRGVAKSYVITVSKPTQVFPGDVNNNGKIDLLDVVKIQLHYIGSAKLEGINADNADVNRDGKISLIDVVKAQKLYIGLE